MNSRFQIGIIGDFDGRPSHLATEAALQHAAGRLGVSVETIWFPTMELEQKIPEQMETCSGLWCAPGSPYKSMKGAMDAIRFAREKDYPFLGTCGGFQHAVLEFGRDVLKIKELGEASFDPYQPNHYITPLTCSLLGQTRRIRLENDSSLLKIYGTGEIVEQYNCSFGLDKAFQSLLTSQGFQVTGSDDTGEARVMTLEYNKFFVVTLYQPQLSSDPEHPHPLIMEFVKLSMERGKQ